MFNQVSKINATVKAAFLVIGILASSTQVTLAQSAQTPASPSARAASANCSRVAPRPARPMVRYNGQQNSMYSTQPLSSPISIAGLPTYNGGSTYESGLNYSQLKAGQCYIMRYSAKDRADRVMKSYKDSLTQYGWEINQSQTNAKQLTAAKTKEGLYVTFCVFPSSKPGYASNYEIKYLATGVINTQSM
jgi:hypothetical protein